MGSVERPVRVAILECDTPLPNTQAKFGGYGGVFQALLRSGAEQLGRPDPEHGFTFSVHQIQVDPDNYPPLEGLDAILITGSKYDSFADIPWVNKLVEYTTKALDSGRVKVVGVCFGHQIVGRALGVKVGRNEAWEASAIHQMHRDIVFAYPEGVEALGSSPVCQVQGMYASGRLFTIQGHPEFNKEITTEILSSRHDAGTPGQKKGPLIVAAARFPPASISMRLTADLINASLSYLNPLKERELDLRANRLRHSIPLQWELGKRNWVTGHKIPIIENLGVAGACDAIDFTDNDLGLLTNFPLSPRLNTLLCARNRVQGVDRRLGDTLPNLTTLVLTSNLVKELGDLEGLRGCRRLTHLSLVENPVQKREHYRSYMIWLCPSLRFLDFQRIKDAERERAAELFGTHSEPTELAAKIGGVKTKTFDSSANPPINGTRVVGSSGKAIRTKLTDTETARLKELLNSKTLTLDDFARIEKDLAEGRIPRGIADADRSVT
ncbi:hypothetical protein DV738_g4687, partial [Chaetothyriales sp. CBS 135597]